jgi:TolA-binding protein
MKYGKRFRLTLLNSLSAALCGLWLLSGCGGGAGPSPGKFHEGRTALMQGKFQTAIDLLTEHLLRHPAGDLAGRASFLIGKAHLGLGDWNAAETWFQNTIDKYPQTEEAHKARFKIALAKMLQGETADAQRRFAELAEQREGPYTPEAVALARFLDNDLDNAENR